MANAMAIDKNHHSTQRILKRCIDLNLSFLLLLLLSPLFVLIALLIVLDDGWPVLYRRRVIGQKGEFDAFKFRSMRRDADVVLANDPVLKLEFEQNFKLKNDPRLTRLGRYLRTLSLDELPQLINVLKGQMSLVGPRMITAREISKYGEYKHLLLRVKPGITGYWQINGRQDVSYEQRVRMDISYVENWSLLKDLKILVLTPVKVFKREGAY
jgi:lipopolysaccharide/colanic/teichoic acid biosynthesis glycosyltransferase